MSANRLNRGPAGVVVVVPCTPRRREVPSHVELDPGTSGLDELSYAKGEDVESVSEQRLVTRLGSASTEELFRIGQVLRVLLDL